MGRSHADSCLPAEELDKRYIGWGHEPVGYYTDYFYALLCAVFSCLSIAAASLEGRLVASAMAVLAVAFFCGGTSHLRLDAYYQMHKPLGLHLNEKRHDWMYWWLPAVSLAPAGRGMIVAAVLGMSGFSSTCVYTVLGLGMLAGLVEAAVWAKEQLGFSGLAGTLWAILSMAMAVGAALLRPGLRLLAIGAALELLGNLMMLLTGARVVPEVPEKRIDICAFKQVVVFDTNSLFHIILTLAVVCFYLGVTT